MGDSSGSAAREGAQHGRRRRIGSSTNGRNVRTRRVTVLRIVRGLWNHLPMAKSWNAVPLLHKRFEEVTA